MTKRGELPPPPLEVRCKFAVIHKGRVNAVLEDGRLVTIPRKEILEVRRNPDGGGSVLVTNTHYARRKLGL